MALDICYSCGDLEEVEDGFCSFCREKRAHWDEEQRKNLERHCLQRNVEIGREKRKTEQ